MPYKIVKRKCKQSDGDHGSYVLSYTDKKGKKHRACHTSKKKMQGQIAAALAERDFVSEKFEAVNEQYESISKEYMDLLASREVSDFADTPGSDCGSSAHPRWADGLDGDSFARC